VRKKIIALVMTAIMVISSVSCGSSNKSASDYQYRNIDISGPTVTITYLTIGDKPINGMTEKVLERLNQILLEKANAKLDIYYIGWNDYLENYNKTLDMGNVNVDLVAAGSDWLDAWPNAVKGNFLPLSSEMLQTYCPQTYRYVSATDWKSCSYNDKIYFIPENEYTQWINNGFVYRADLAKNAGIGEIQDWDDMTRYFNDIRDKTPDMIPWDADGKGTDQALGYIMSETKYIPIYELSQYGIWGIYKDIPNIIISPYLFGNTLEEYAKLMKQWNKMNVWQDDFKDFKGDYTAFYNGESAVVLANTEEFYTKIKPDMDIYQPESNVKFFWFGKNKNLVKRSILHGAIAVYSKSKNPERALMVYDILRNDPECYRLIRYGIEGVQYQINQKNMLEKPSGYNEERDGITTNFWWGRRDAFELDDSDYAWEEYRELQAEYNKVAVGYPWDRTPFSTAIINEKIKAVTKVCDKYIPEITYGRYDDAPEDEVRKFRKELKEAGIEEVTKYLQNTYESEYRK